MRDMDRYVTNRVARFIHDLTLDAAAAAQHGATQIVFTRARREVDAAPLRRVVAMIPGHLERARRSISNHEAPSGVGHAGAYLSREPRHMKTGWILDCYARSGNRLPGFIDDDPLEPEWWAQADHERQARLDREYLRAAEVPAGRHDRDHFAWPQAAQRELPLRVSHCGGGLSAHHCVEHRHFVLNGHDRTCDRAVVRPQHASNERGCRQQLHVAHDTRPVRGNDRLAPAGAVKCGLHRLAIGAADVVGMQHGQGVRPGRHAGQLEATVGARRRARTAHDCEFLAQAADGLQGGSGDWLARVRVQHVAADRPAAMHLDVAHLEHAIGRLELFERLHA